MLIGYRLENDNLGNPFFLWGDKVLGLSTGSGFGVLKGLGSPVIQKSFQPKRGTVYLFHGKRVDSLVCHSNNAKHALLEQLGAFGAETWPQL